MPIYMRIDGIKGDVVEAAVADAFVWTDTSAAEKDHDKWTELTSFSNGAHKGGGGNTARDDVVVDGLIITGENPAAQAVEGRPGENLTLNYTKITYDSAAADGAGGGNFCFGDGSVRFATTDFDLV